MQFMKNTTQRQREDRLLDYIATHQKEIMRYLTVVLIGEIWQWVLATFIYNLVPFFKAYQSAFSFLFWALPYFVVCKLWVWRQRGDDKYTWMMQSMKFIMCGIVIGLIRLIVVDLLGLMVGSAAVLNMLTVLCSEVLYFLAMYKIVLKPKN